MSELGIMTVHILEAIFERDVCTFLKMSPRYILNWKENKIEGKPAYDGGKTPKWTSSHDFNVGTDLSTSGFL
jgi:hypothetical protein